MTIEVKDESEGLVIARYKHTAYKDGKVAELSIQFEPAEPEEGDEY